MPTLSPTTFNLENCADAPTYMKLAQELERSRIGLKKPVRLPTEVKLAQKYQVARDTLRRAMTVLEDRGGVTRRRGDGTYLHPVQAMPASVKHRSIGFVPPWWAKSLNAWYTATVFDGVSSFADEHQCHLNILKADLHDDDADAMLEKAADLNLCGLIWVHPVPEQLPLLKAVSKRLPCVVVGRDYRDENLHSVLPDYQEAAKLVDACAVQFGHHNYSVLGRSSTDPYSESWINGIESACAARGSHFNEASYYVNVTPFGRDGLADLLLDHHLTTPHSAQLMLLTSSSYLAFLLANERFRKRVEDGLSLITFDYGVQAMNTYWPGMSITHVSCDWNRIGARAVEALVSILEGPEPPQAILEPVHLVEGQTMRPYA